MASVLRLQCANSPADNPAVGLSFGLGAGCTAPLVICWGDAVERFLRRHLGASVRCQAVQVRQRQPGVWGCGAYATTTHAVWCWRR